MTKLVALIKVYTRAEYSEYENFTSVVAQSITDWTEISDEDFKLFQKYGFSENKFKDEEWIMVEKPIDVKFKVDELLNYYREVDIARKKEEEKKLDADRKRREAREAKKLLKAQKEEKASMEQELKLFEELKKKFEGKK